jgi:cell division protein FtsB
MNKIRRTKKIGDYLSSVVVLILLILIVLFIGKSSIKMYKRSQETKSFYQAVEQEYSSLENRYQEISKDLEYINSDTGLEREVRARFDLSRKGEKAIFIIEEELPPLPPPKEKTFFEKTKDLFSF